MAPQSNSAKFDLIGAIILWVYGLGLAIGLILLIYFLLKRLEARKSEDFEKREN